MPAVRRRLVVAGSYGNGKTKTGVERWMPVHPVLAAMLAEWKLAGTGRSKVSVHADLTLATYTYRPVGSPPAQKTAEKK